MLSKGLYYDRVPKDRLDNIRYRREILTRAADDVRFQQQLNEACRHDLLFWINTFAWVVEPRPRKVNGIEFPQVIPMITWSHQDKGVLTIEENLGTLDIGIEKSRDEGATWLVLQAFLRRWTYVPGSYFGIVSRNMDAADNSDDPDSLMSKLDWEIGRLPQWMVGRRARVGTLDGDWTRNLARHSLRNLRIDCSIMAYAATGDIARGGRKTAILLDEYGSFKPGEDKQALDSTGPATDCRIVLSTPNGPTGEYYEFMHERTSSMVKVVLDWKDNDVKNRGLYRVVDGVPYAVDVEQFGDLPPEYKDKKQWEKLRERLTDRGYNLEDKLRSPWYDRVCLRNRMTPRRVAKEYDRDYGGSVSKVFASSLIDRLLIQHARPCLASGQLVFDHEDHLPKWSPRNSGHLRIWFTMDASNRPPAGEYVVTADISMGTGSDVGSNSTMTVCNLNTGDKVAEFAEPRISPQNLAHYAVAMCNWFRGPNGPAMLCWETNGIGTQFTQEIKVIGFRRVWMRKPTGQFTAKATTKMGWHNNPENLKILFGAYESELISHRFLNHSREAIEEMRDYEYDITGKIIHARAARSDDPSGAGAAHGDRVISDAQAAYLMQEIRKGRRKEKQQGNPFENTAQNRREEYLRSLKKGREQEIFTF